MEIASYNKHHSAPFLRALVDSPSPSLLGRGEPTTLSNQLTRLSPTSMSNFAKSHLRCIEIARAPRETVWELQNLKSCLGSTGLPSRFHCPGAGVVMRTPL